MKGTAMKNIKGLLLGIGVAALLSGSALAADVLVRKAPAAAPAPATPLWDLAFGAALMSDYNFRGVSQSNREISFGAYGGASVQSRRCGQFYAGLAAWRVNWPSDAGIRLHQPGRGGRHHRRLAQQVGRLRARSRLHLLLLPERGLQRLHQQQRLLGIRRQGRLRHHTGSQCRRERLLSRPTC